MKTRLDVMVNVFDIILPISLSETLFFLLPSNKVHLGYFLLNKNQVTLKC